MDIIKDFSEKYPLAWQEFDEWLLQEKNAVYRDLIINTKTPDLIICTIIQAYLDSVDVYADAYKAYTNLKEIAASAHQHNNGLDLLITQGFGLNRPEALYAACNKGMEIRNDTLKLKTKQ